MWGLSFVFSTVFWEPRRVIQESHPLGSSIHHRSTLRWGMLLPFTLKYFLAQHRWRSNKITIHSQHFRQYSYKDKKLKKNILVYLNPNQIYKFLSLCDWSSWISTYRHSVSAHFTHSLQTPFPGGTCWVLQPIFLYSSSPLETPVRCVQLLHLFLNSLIFCIKSDLLQCVTALDSAADPADCSDVCPPLPGQYYHLQTLQPSALF